MTEKQVPKKDFLRIVKFLALVGGARGDQDIPTDQMGVPKFLVKRHLEWALGFFEQSAGWPDGLEIPKKYTTDLVEASGAILKHMERAFALPIIQFDKETKELAGKLPDKFTINYADCDNASKIKAVGTLYSKKSYPSANEFDSRTDDEIAKEFANDLNRLLTQVFASTTGSTTKVVVPPTHEPPAPALAPAPPTPPTPAKATPTDQSTVAPASPVAKNLNTGSQHNIKALSIALENGVLDQPLAIREFLQEVQARNLGLNPTDKPAMFLLAGPPGCGKSLMTKIISQTLGANKPVLLLNMAAMTSRNEGFGLTGLRRGYESAAPGKLTDFIRKNPEGIVILDQFDRAHPNVQNLLIPLFTDGELTDEYGFKEHFLKNAANPSTISFNKCWIFLISAKGDGAFESVDYETQYSSDVATGTQHLADRLLADLTRVSTSAAENKPDEFGQSGLAAYLPTCRVLPFHPVGLPGLLEIAESSVTHFQASLAKSNISTPWANELRDQLKWALVLASGPDITPLDAELAVGRDLAAALTAQALSTGLETVSQLNLTLDSSGEPWFERWCQGEVAPKTIIKDLFRRNQRLAYVVTPEFNEETRQITLHASNFKLVSVPNVHDHGHDTGINLNIPDIRFADIKGHQHIKSRLTEVKDLLLKQAQFSAPKGMLLYGRPGTGKTMLAKALAGETDMPFIAVTGPQLLSLETVRKVFKLARKYAPSILFIDEVDALGVRGKGGVDVVINQILAEIDGFKSSSEGNVFVLAATNFREKVDPAIIRSGRLDWVIEVPALDKDAREHFFTKIQAALGENWPKEPQNLMEKLLHLSAGMSGADLEKLQRELQMLLLRRSGAIGLSDMLECINDIKHGTRLKKPQLEKQLASTAYHEAGHAIVSLALNPNVSIEQVTIGARGTALGFTAYNAEDVSPDALTRKEVLELMCVSLAGRIAESKKFPSDATDVSGGPDAGASSDLAKATELAWMAITQWGLDEQFGWVSLKPISDVPPRFSEKAAERVEEWVKEARHEATRQVETYWLQIEQLAQRLIKDETVLCPLLGDAPTN